jgi:putative nucleotidyltransferase with HDIG domain
MESEGSSSRNKRDKKDNGRPLRGKSIRRSDLLELLFRSHWAWGVAFTVALTMILVPGWSFEPVRYELGAIAPVDIRAPYDFSYEDEVTTQSRREEAGAEVLDVYDFNNQASLQSVNAINDAFRIGRETLADIGALDDVAQDQLFLDVREALGVQLSEEEFSVLMTEEFRVEVEEGLASAVGSILRKDLVASKERLESSGRPITRYDDSTRVRGVVDNFSGFLTTEQAEQSLAELIGQIPEISSPSQRHLVALGSRFITPTLTFNFVETEQQRQAAREEVDPVFFQVRKGKVIVRAGDEIDNNILRQLEILSAAEGSRWRLAKVAGAFVLSALLMLSLWKLMRPVQAKASWRKKSFALVGIIIIFHLALARFVFFLAGALSGQLLTPPFNNETSYYYVVPFAAVAILVRLLENRPSAMLASVVFSVLLGLMSADLYLGAFCLLSCLGAILGYLQYKQRTALIKAGLYVGSVNFFIVLGIDLLTERFTPGITFSFDLLCAFLGGAAVSVVLSVLLPALESLFQRTTDIKLLELANHNIPVLRQLTLEAPGTYHHSVVVGTMAEAAAEAIGASGTFCRTAALYHDIGKIKKVDYFVENQEGPNKHDKLSPRMSALIIASHVKEGIEMAREMDLPQQIIDIIPQHHGTKLIKYFYEKAKEHHDPSLGEISEEEYRYPGPKPQTKEAGIIMIADGVEAASRTLEDPSPARLKGVIRQIIDYIFVDGQLDECDLTLRDLDKISRVFLRVLQGMHHHRVDYPGFDFEKKVEPVVVQDQSEKGRGIGA